MIKKITLLTLLLSQSKLIKAADFVKYVATGPTAEQLAVKIDGFKEGTPPNTFKSAAGLIKGPDAGAFQAIYDESQKPLSRGQKRNTQLALKAYRNAQAAAAAQQLAAQRAAEAAQIAAQQQAAAEERRKREAEASVQQLAAQEAQANVAAEQSRRDAAAAAQQLAQQKENLEKQLEDTKKAAADKAARELAAEQARIQNLEKEFIKKGDAERAVLNKRIEGLNQKISDLEAVEQRERKTIEAEAQAAVQRIAGKDAEIASLKRIIDAKDSENAAQLAAENQKCKDASESLKNENAGITFQYNKVLATNTKLKEALARLRQEFETIKAELIRKQAEWDKQAGS